MKSKSSKGMDRIKHYSDLISQIDVMSQPAIRVGGRWKKYGNDIVKKILEGNTPILISRADLKKEQNSAEKIVKTLMWGYNNGGRGDNVESILNALPEVYEALNEKFSIDYKIEYKDVGELQDKLKRDDGCKIGRSTFSKLLYFWGYTIGGYPAIIIDDNVGLAASMFHEFNKLKPTSDYEESIKIFHEVARELQLAPQDYAKLEYFLFLLGKTLKSLHSEIRRCTRECVLKTLSDISASIMKNKQ